MVHSLQLMGMPVPGLYTESPLTLCYCTSNGHCPLLSPTYMYVYMHTITYSASYLTLVTFDMIILVFDNDSNILSLSL